MLYSMLTSMQRLHSFSQALKARQRL